MSSSAGPPAFGLTAAATLALPGSTTAGEEEDWFLLGLEEHVATAELRRLNGIQFPPGTPRFDINDVGAGRIADLDAAGINLQGRSALTPGAQNLPGTAGVAYARPLNSWVATEVSPAYPDRFRAFAHGNISRSGRTCSTTVSSPRRSPRSRSREPSRAGSS